MLPLKDPLFERILTPNLPGRFPSTRFQGSKRKILRELALALSAFEFSNCLDLYAGSGSVSLLLRVLGKKVDANDYLAFSRLSARLFLTVKAGDFANLDYYRDLKWLLETKKTEHKSYVSDIYAGIFFTDRENAQIDNFAQNIDSFSDYRRDLYTYAMGQALLMKRPYNLFHRANLNMRTRDVERSFGNKKTWETPFLTHCTNIIRELSQFPFPENLNDSKIFDVNTRNLESLPRHYDLIYADPPYLNSKGGATDYVDFYHFLDGLTEYQLFFSGDSCYPHKPINRQNSGWSSVEGAIDELERLVAHWRDSIIFLSYRSDGSPAPPDVADILRAGGRKVLMHTCGEYKYALSRTNSNEEIFLISLP